MQSDEWPPPPERDPEAFEFTEEREDSVLYWTLGVVFVIVLFLVLAPT